MLRIDSFGGSSSNTSTMESTVLLMIFIFLPVALSLFSPMFAFLILCITSLVIFSSSIGEKIAFYLFFLNGFLGSLFISLIASGQPIFLFVEQDFTTYYNNYVDFLRSGFSFDFFPFGKGFEIGLPLVNFFLSILIDGPYPNLVKLGHAFIQSSLIVALVNVIRVNLGLSFRDAGLLLTLSFLFFKFPSTLNHLRQGYASVILLIAIFSRGKAKQITLLVIASAFHVSSLLLFFVIRFLLERVNSRNYKISVILSIITSLTIFSSIEIILGFIMSADVSLLGKLAWGFEKALNVDYIKSNIFIIITALLYFFPLMLYGAFLKFSYSYTPPLFWSLLLISSILLTFIYLPGIPIRSLSSIFYFLIGYYYFVFFKETMNVHKRLLIYVVIALFILVRWLFSPWMNYNYPVVSLVPLYYLDALFVESDKVRRSSLPLYEDIQLNNENVYH